MASLNPQKKQEHIFSLGTYLKITYYVKNNLKKNLQHSAKKRTDRHFFLNPVFFYLITWKFRKNTETLFYKFNDTYVFLLLGKDFNKYLFVVEVFQCRITFELLNDAIRKLYNKV